MKKANSYYMLAMLSLLSFNCAISAPTDPWYQRAWQSVRPYFGWILGGSATGAAAGAGIAQRYKMNPCVGAACGAVAGGLLAGGGSAFLTSRVDKNAEEYVQNLSALLSVFASQVRNAGHVFANNDELGKVLLNVHAPSAKIYFGLTTVPERFEMLIRPWMTLRDKISGSIFNLFKGEIEKVLRSAKSQNDWDGMRFIVQHVNNIMSPNIGTLLVDYNYAGESYNAEKIDELIEKVKALRKN